MDRLLGVIFILVLGSSSAQAGLIFTDQAAFNAAVAGLQAAWSEDFEGFPVGDVSEPVVIGNDKARVSYTETTVNNSRSNIKNNIGTKELEGPDDGLPMIDGIGGLSLDVQAVSLGFRSLFPIAWVFDSSLGVDLSLEFPGNSGLPLSFIGWVGATSDESLTTFRAVGTKGINGNIIDIDDIQAFRRDTTSITEPGTLALLITGVTGLLLLGLYTPRRGTLIIGS